MEYIIEKIKLSTEDRSLLIKSLGFTFFWGLLAHTYGFTNGLFSHDSLQSIVRLNKFKLQLGRFMAYLVRRIFRQGITMPWLIGMLSLLYIGLAVYLIIKIFDIKSSLAIFLTAGILTTNITVTALIGTYIHDLDLNMLALLFAVGSVYCWKYYKWGYLFGAALVCISLGFYQAYFSLAVLLIISLSILLLIEGEDYKKVFFNGLKGILMLLIGCGLYAVAVKFSCRIFNVSLSSTANGLRKITEQTDIPLRQWIIQALYDWKDRMGALIPVFSRRTEIIISGLLLIGPLIMFALAVQKKQIKWQSVLLIVLLVFAMPITANLIYVLSKGEVHNLMILSFFCPYLLILAMDWSKEFPKKFKMPVQLISCVLFLVLLWGNVQTSNALYLKKDLEKQATLSVMTRVVDGIERYPGYERGVTPVVIYGKYEQKTVYGFEKYAAIIGAEHTSAISISRPRPEFYVNMYDAYFKYILNSNTNICDFDTWERLKDNEQVKAMPVFPKEGYIQMVDGILVVKMNEKFYDKY